MIYQIWKKYFISRRLRPGTSAGKVFAAGSLNPDGDGYFAVCCHVFFFPYFGFQREQVCHMFRVEPNGRIPLAVTGPGFGSQPSPAFFLPLQVFPDLLCHFSRQRNKIPAALRCILPGGGCKFIFYEGQNRIKFKCWKVNAKIQLSDILFQEVLKRFLSFRSFVLT